MDDPIFDPDVFVVKLNDQQQLYYHSLSKACVGWDKLKRNDGLQNLSAGPNISEYMPALNAYICKGLTENLEQYNLRTLNYYLLMIEAILENKAVDLSNYLLQFMPIVKKCIIAEKICLDQVNENHWDVRDFASRLLSTITWKYTSFVIEMTDANIKEFAKIIWNCEIEPLNTIYGALVALADFGPINIRCYVLPFIKTKIGPRLEQHLENKSTTSVDYVAALCIKIVLLKCVAPLLDIIRDPPLQLHQYKNHFGYLGPDIHQKISRMYRPDNWPKPPWRHPSYK